MPEKIIRVTKGFRITIPKEFREELGLKIGDRVIYQQSSDGVLIVPAVIVPKQ